MKITINNVEADSPLMKKLVEVFVEEQSRIDERAVEFCF